MVRNYLKISWRNILKHKFFSIINLLGLTIGIAGCLFILLYISDELSYDKFHAKGNDVYRVALHGKLAGQEVRTVSTCPPLARTMVAEVPEVKEATRLLEAGEVVFRLEGKAFNEENIFFADSNFFSVFSFKLREGDPSTALKEPNTLVLTPSLAIKYFGQESPIGKLMVLGNEKTSYKVTGVMEDVPGHSHVQFNALLSMNSNPYSRDGGWLSNSFLTYYVLHEKASAVAVDQKLDGLVDKYVSPVLQQFMGRSLKEFQQQGGIYDYFSVPLYDIHLYSDLDDEPEPQGDIAYVYILGAIGLFILLIACINFMNLSTAKSSGRAKEVGLRKTLGSLRNQLIGQFLTESIMYSIGAALLALLLVYFLLPEFNLVAGKNLQMRSLLKPVLLLSLFIMVALVGFMAGSYPAFYLTSFKITDVLKGKLKTGMKSGTVRSFLVTFQFWISIVLIICTAIVYKQLQYIQKKNLGIDKELELVIYNMDQLEKNRNAFKNELLGHSNIAAASYSNNAIPGVNNTTIFRAEGTDNDHIMATYFVDYDYLETMGLELSEGRFFSRDVPSDSGAVVINEAAVKEFGWENPLENKVVDFTDDNEMIKLPVIGVLKDFNFESLKSNVRPLVLKLTNTGRVLTVRIVDTKSIKEVLTVAERQWEKYMAKEPFEYSFLDEDFDALFRAEQRLGKVFMIFTFLAIFIACLGLYGLSAFTAEQRTKEIGIRKVLGATTWNITSLLSSEFTKLVIIAFVLSIFPAYYIMNNWLNNFAYSVDMEIWVFVAGGLLALVIAWATVSYQAMKAAKINPVNSLKYE